MHLIKFTVVALLVGATVRCGATAGQARAASPVISLRSVGEPASRVVAAVARSSGRDLAVSKELAGQKLVVIVRQMPTDRVLAAVAELLGARWVAAGKGAQRLERLPGVRDWCSRRALARADAEKRAKEVGRRFIRSNMDEALSHVDDPDWDAGGSLDRGLTQFLKTIPPAALDRLSQSMMEMTPVRPGGARATDPPPALVIPAEELTQGQRDVLGAWLTGRSREATDFNSRLAADLPRCSVALTSTDGVGVDVQIARPGDAGRTATFAVFGSAYSPAKLDALASAETADWARANPPPNQAALGSVPDDIGRPDRAVTIDSEEEAGRQVEMPTRRLLRTEFLCQFADAVGVAIVADHYTLADRAEARTAPLRQLLQGVVGAYATAFRIRDGVLLARRLLWSEDDPREAPWPHPDPWLSAKREGRPLALVDVARMAALSNEQLDALGCYRDGPVTLERETVACRASQRQRRALVWYAGATEAERRGMNEAGGTPVGRLSADRARELISVTDPRVVAAGVRIAVVVAQGAVTDTASLVLLLPDGRREPLASVGGVTTP
ncbi:MAG: hypothetical protein NT029_22145 [Armatimonadetes bacterium]|nr:hypothetical protein [Armatimonadota bacterium]